MEHDTLQDQQKIDELDSEIMDLQEHVNERIEEIAEEYGMDAVGIARQVSHNTLLEFASSGYEMYGLIIQNMLDFNQQKQQIIRQNAQKMNLSWDHGVY